MRKFVRLVPKICTIIWNFQTSLISLVFSKWVFARCDYQSIAMCDPGEQRPIYRISPALLVL